MNRQSEELFDKYLTETLTPSESKLLAELLEKDENEGHHLGNYLLETALMLKACEEIEAQHEIFCTSSESAIRWLPSRFWLLGLAASLMVVAGVWRFSQRQDGALGLRVAEVQGSGGKTQARRTVVYGPMCRSAAMR